MKEAACLKTCYAICNHPAVSDDGKEQVLEAEHIQYENSIILLYVYWPCLKP